MLLHLLAVSLALVVDLVSAGLFAEDSLVKMIGHKEFKAAMKENMTSVVAFVTPTCEDCKRMAPEYNNAALGLYPLVPLYAVDCAVPTNKRLCADNAVKDFPTVKLFPRGKYMEPSTFNGSQPSATELYYFAQYGIPSKMRKIHYFEDLNQINDGEILGKHRVLLMKRPNKMPLVWLVLANKYGDDIVFFSHRDWRGRSSVKMGFEAGEEGESKVLIFPAGETKPVPFKGILKFDTLSEFLDTLLSGGATIDELNAEAEAEEFVPDPKELEIERQQGAEMLKLAHGGFANLLDFEAAGLDGSAKNFHGKQGYPGMMGGAGHISSETVMKMPPEATMSSSSTKSNVMIPLTEEARQITLDIDIPTAVAFATPTATQAEERVKDEL